MGVPQFWGSWLKPRFTRECRGRPESILIDMNGLLHEVFNELGDTETDDFFKLYCSRLRSALDETILPNVTPALKNLIMCVDGVAPLAKIMQQRKRRCKDLTGLHDRNMISPGTLFMEIVDSHIRGWIERSQLPTNTIYSSHKNAGEGEHKLFFHLKSMRASLGKGPHLIIGLDSDFAMLSVASGIQGIWLYRKLEHESWYLSIDDLNNGLKEMGPSYAGDFCAMVSLIGNDFVPRLPHIGDVGEYINKMIDVRKRIELPLTTRGDIIWSNMFTFLRALFETVDQDFIKFRERSFRYRHMMLEECTGRTQDEGKSVTYFDRDKFSKMWIGRAMLMEGLNHLGSNTTSKLMAFEYLRMISWNLKYYFTHFEASSWMFYPFNFAPLASDLITVPIGLLRPTQTPKRELTDYEQLHLILPSRSSSLIPRCKENLLTVVPPGGYPTILEGCNAEYHGITIVPFPDISLILNSHIGSSGLMEEEIKHRPETRVYRYMPRADIRKPRIRYVKKLPL